VRGNGSIRPESDPGAADRAPRRRTWVLVVVLLVIPGALYAALPVVPFLPLTTAQKIWVSSGLVVAAEVVFWGAAFFVDKEVVTRYRRFLDPRALFRKR
jgi:hypothetical protein